MWNIKEKTFQVSRFQKNSSSEGYTMAVCYVCGKKNLTKDEKGITKKLIDKKTKHFYCLSCLAEYLEVTEEELLDKIEEFKNEGCILFQ